MALSGHRRGTPHQEREVRGGSIVRLSRPFSCPTQRSKLRSALQDGPHAEVYRSAAAHRHAPAEQPPRALGPTQLPPPRAVRERGRLRLNVRGQRRVWRREPGGPAAQGGKWERPVGTGEPKSTLCGWLQILRPFLLRRIKADVEKSLLPKKEFKVGCDHTSAC
jgi:hypothetical protein